MDNRDGLYEYDHDLYHPHEDEGLFVYGHQVHETDKAVLWHTKSGAEEWIPKTQILSIEPGEFVLITDWLADKKGWDEHVNREPQQSLNFDIKDDIPF